MENIFWKTESGTLGINPLLYWIIFLSYYFLVFVVVPFLSPPPKHQPHACVQDSMQIRRSHDPAKDPGEVGVTGALAVSLERVMAVFNLARVKKMDQM